MKVIQKLPRKTVRVRIDAFEEGRQIAGVETIHLTDCTSMEVYLKIAKALGIEDQLLAQTEEEHDKEKRRRLLEIRTSRGAGGSTDQAS